MAEREGIGGGASGRGAPPERVGALELLQRARSLLAVAGQEVGGIEPLPYLPAIRLGPRGLDEESEPLARPPAAVGDAGAGQQRLDRERVEAMRQICVGRCRGEVRG